MTYRISCKYYNDIIRATWLCNSTYVLLVHTFLFCCVGFIQIAITTIANLSNNAEDSGQFFDVDQVCMYPDHRNGLIRLQLLL